MMSIFDKGDNEVTREGKDITQHHPPHPTLYDAEGTLKERGDAKLSQSLTKHSF